jgi:hypothetical protein
MTAATLLQKAARDGVRVYLENEGKVKACGPRDALARWTPSLREHKRELVEELSKPLRPLTPPKNTVGDVTSGQSACASAPPTSSNPRPRLGGPTDRFCVECGELATIAYPTPRGCETWICIPCLPHRGEA